MRRYRRRLLLLVIAAPIIALIVFFIWPSRSTYTISPETTYITGPLDHDGHVDYATAVNERLSKGVTPDNNAFALLWKALGPRPEGGKGMSPEYFQWLGIEVPPDQGDYFVDWNKYVKEQLKIEDSEERRILDEVQTRNGKWPWKREDEPRLAKWLDSNDKPLAIVVEATKRPEFFNPLVPGTTNGKSNGLISCLLPAVQKCRALANALTCRAQLRLAEGEIDEAWQDLLACHRLARLMSRGGTLIEHLVSIAIDAIACNAELTFLSHAKLTSKQAMACLKDLQNLPPMSSLADKMDGGERMFCLDGVLLLVRDGLSQLNGLAGPSGTPTQRSPFEEKFLTRSINWDPALKNINLFFDRIAAAVRITNRQAREQEMVAIESEIKAARQRSGEEAGSIRKVVMGPEQRGEMIGNTLIGLLLPAFQKIQQAADRIEQTNRNQHLALALAAYRADNGKYPAKLDELAPKYLKSILSDLFSSQPLIYRPTDSGYLLYSVGQNGQDDGGRWYDDDPRGDDPRVRMPVPEPKPIERKLPPDE
jgi:type II secretory pathway pseudopilin PulG